MDALRVFTEEPEVELWKALLRYSYATNIKRYFSENHIVPKEDGNSCINCISGALLQADEYYRASQGVSLQVRPLLLYYGTTSLLYAMYVLMSGTIPDIKCHGMRIEVAADDKPFIADTLVRFDNPRDGGVHLFAKQLGYDVNLCELVDWDLGMFLDSIAEIAQEFEECYTDRRSHVLLLNTVKTPDGDVEKVFLNEGGQEVFAAVEGLNKAFLTPQEVRYQQGGPYYVLRRKMAGKDITRVSYSGQPYLQVAHRKGKGLVTVSSELGMYISLFVLGSLCRYHPEKWNPFVTQDSTGERLLVEKLLYYARRMLPNVVLNAITGRPTIFVTSRFEPDSRIQPVGEHEVREIVRKAVGQQLRAEQARHVMHGSEGQRNGD